MDYEQAVAYIEALPRFAGKPSLLPMQALMQALDNPQKALKCVHVAGTNGKGSTVTMCANILQKAGYKVGLTVSPYVVDFRERYQINGKMIEKDKFLQLFHQVKAAQAKAEEQGYTITGFVFMAAIAFLYFAQEHCDIAVVETGLGGRFDATNVIESPLVCAITSIGLDHTQVLGDTLEKIAFEKAGIIKENTPVVCYPLQDAGVLAVLMEQAAKKHAPFLLPNANSAQIVSESLQGTDVLIGGQALHIPLLGRYQVYNTLTVLEMVRALQNKGYAISPQAVQQGIASTRFAARCEVLRRSPLVLLDGAHNDSGAKSLADTLKELKVEDGVFICAMMQDKDYQNSLRDFAPFVHTMLCVQVSTPRCLSANDLCRSARQAGINACACEGLPQAVAQALKLAGNTRPIVVCGSLFLASNIRQILIAEMQN